MIYKYKIYIGADQKTVTVNADSPEKAKEKVQKYANKLNAQYKGKKLQRMGDSIDKKLKYKCMYMPFYPPYKLKTMIIQASSKEEAKSLWEPGKKYGGYGKLQSIASYGHSVDSKTEDSMHPLDYIKRISGMTFKDENELLDYVKKTYPKAFLNKRKEVTIYGGTYDVQGDIALKNGKPVIYMMDSCATDADYPGYGVEYVSGYAGNGVNHKEVKYFRTEKEQKDYANKLKANHVIGVKTFKIDNFYHTKDASAYRVVQEAYNALNELGYNNSTGKYDEIVKAVKSIYGQTLLDAKDPRFKSMIKTEVLKQLKRRGYDSKVCDANGVHRITYKDIDGITNKETIVGDLNKLEKRIKELKDHGCKIVKQENFINWGKDSCKVKDAKVIAYITLGSKKYPVYSEIPSGWKITSMQGLSTAPNGYKWIDNNKSRFGNSGREVAFVKVKDGAYIKVEMLKYAKDLMKALPKEKFNTVLKTKLINNFPNASDAEIQEVLKVCKVTGGKDQESIDSCTTDAKTLNDYNTDQLREIAVALGGDRKKLYGTSKDSMIYKIYQLEKSSGKKWKDVVKDSCTTDASYSEFKSIYDDFMKKCNKLKFENPKNIAEATKLDTFIREERLSALDKLNNEFNKMSREKTMYYEKVRNESMTIQQKLYDRYLENEKKNK